jgi:hypothetical protein
MCRTQKFSFSRDPVILDLKLQLALGQESISGKVVMLITNPVSESLKIMIFLFFSNSVNQSFERMKIKLLLNFYSKVLY